MVTRNNNRTNFLKSSTLFGTTLLTTSVMGATAAAYNDAVRKDTGKVPQQSKKRKLGSGEHSIEVSAPGLGCMGMSYHRRFIPDRQTMIAAQQTNK